MIRPSSGESICRGSSACRDYDTYLQMAYESQADRFSVNPKP